MLQGNSSANRQSPLGSPYTEPGWSFRANGNVFIISPDPSRRQALIKRRETGPEDVPASKRGKRFQEREAGYAEVRFHGSDGRQGFLWSLQLSRWHATQHLTRYSNLPTIHSSPQVLFLSLLSALATTQCSVLASESSQRQPGGVQSWHRKPLRSQTVCGQRP